MNHWGRIGMTAALGLWWTYATLAGSDADDKPAATAAGLPQLNVEQQRAVGIRVAHPVMAKTPERIAAIGLVLDGTTLLQEDGEAKAAAAAERSAAGEIARLRELYHGGAGASLKVLEAAESEHVRLQTEAQVAAARLGLHWGPIADLPIPAREKIFAAAQLGRSLLVRAELPGRHSLGVLPSSALLEVDGIQVPANVLGLLRQGGDLQSVAMLVEVPAPPPGLGPGARVPLTLLSGIRSGVLLPRDAVLYDENGAYVYKQLADRGTKEGVTSYAPVKIQLLAQVADGWLTAGVDDDDEIVVHGAGVLWSLQGVGTHATDDDDD